jgi:hypothetical protein
LVLGAVALALSRAKTLTALPLGALGWGLLVLGLAPVSLSGAITVLAWFLALHARRQWASRLGRLGFNTLQVLLVLWTLVAAGSLLEALRTGLLGYPDLMITGNGSSAQMLHWFADRYATDTASAWVLSVPVWFYRVLMLLWALWLASALLNWVRWAWDCFSTDGLWKRKPNDASAPVA